MLTRRDFLRTTAVAGGAVMAGGPSALAQRASAAAHGIIAVPAAPLNILVLGGTGFIGPHLVRHAVARGHKVSIFTRGRRDGDLPPGQQPNFRWITPERERDVLALWKAKKSG
jgi:2'-hydroxyisoflavone reductase